MLLRAQSVFDTLMSTGGGAASPGAHALLAEPAGVAPLALAPAPAAPAGPAISLDEMLAMLQEHLPSAGAQGGGGS